MVAFKLRLVFGLCIGQLAADAYAAEPPAAEVGTDGDASPSAPAPASPPAQVTGAQSPSVPEPQALPLDAAADVSGFDSVSLEEILNMRVVTASGTEEDRALAPANVLVVTREDIELHAYRSLAELLAGVPGLFVVDDLVSPSLAVRGVSGGLGGGTRIVRMMINGVQVNFRPDLTAFIGPEYIPMEAVERVEIAKGPLSALYGANAFLATVNVITRKPAAGTSSAVTGRWTRLSRSDGFGASGFVGFNDGHRSLFAGFVVDELDRSGIGLQRTFPAQDLTPQLFEDRSQNDVRRASGAFVELRESNDWLGSLSVQGGLQSIDAGAEFQINSLFSHASRLALYNLWSNALWERSWSELLATTASIGWSQGGPTRNTQLYLPNSRAVVFTPNYSYAALSGKLEVKLSPLHALSVAVGLDAERDTEQILFFSQTFNATEGQNESGDQIDVAIGPDDLRRVTVQNVAGYLKAVLSPLQNLRVTANLRADATAQGPVDFPWQPSWRTAAAYRFSPAVSAKLIAGRAFQMPSAVLTFARPGFGNIGNIVGNVNVPGADSLRPQEVLSVEAGASARVFDAFAIEGELYYQNVQDRIEFIRYGSNYRAANQGEAQQVGIGAMLRSVWQPVSAYLGGDYLWSLADGRLSAEPPAGFPRASGLLGVNIDLSRWHLRGNAELRYKAARGASQGNVFVNDQRPYTLPPYVQADLTVSTIGLHPLGVGTETRLLAGARNLLDTRFSEPGYGGFDLPGLGRMFFIELRQAL